jgi:type I restriction enzyme S subunit
MSQNEISELPEGWVWVTVADLGIIVGGGTPSTKVSQFWNGDIAWITPADLSGYKGKYIGNGKRYLTELGLEYSSAVLLPKNSLLYSTRAPIGYIVITNEKLATNQGFKSLIPLPSTCVDYLYYYLQSAKQLILGMASGTTFLELSLSSFSKIPVPLPPISIQNRIVDKIEEQLSELENGVGKLLDSLKRLEFYKQLILKNAFEGKSVNSDDKTSSSAHHLVQAVQDQRRLDYEIDLAEYKSKLAEWKRGNGAFRRPVRPSKPHSYIPVTSEDVISLPQLPLAWRWERIGNLSFVTKLAGFEFTEFITYSSTGEVPVIKAQNVSKTGFIEGGFSYVPSEVLLELPRIKITGGELLFVFVGAGLGNVGIVPSGRQYLLGPNVGLIKPSIGIYNKYIEYFLTSPIGKENISKLSKATAQGSISMENIRNILVPICSIEEQEEIVEYIELQFTIVEHLTSTIQKNLKKAEVLKSGILKSAFEGRLISSSPDGESAADLLSNLVIEKNNYLIEQKKISRLTPKIKKPMAELKSILTLLTEATAPMSTKDLWQESIYKDDIDAFYAELKIIENKIEVTDNENQSLISLIK